MSAVTKPFSKAPRYIDWARPHTWKDPKYVKPDYAAAFTLIRDILTEKPRSFHAIIEAGLQRHAASQPGSSTAASSKSAVPQAQGGRLSLAKKKLAKKEGLQVIPEGHPFVSNKSVISPCYSIPTLIEQIPENSNLTCSRVQPAHPPQSHPPCRWNGPLRTAPRTTSCLRLPLPLVPLSPTHCSQERSFSHMVRPCRLGPNLFW